MVRTYFRDQVRQIQDSWLSSVADLEDWESQRGDRLRELRRMIGLDPLPERTDLNASVTGTLEHEDFRVEKLYFESVPGLYVTANLYIPKQREGALPGVLYVCGHANVEENGVSFGSKTAYQRHPAWYARHGYVALIIDTVQLGEIEGVHHGTYRLDRWWWWNRGYSPLGVETWNGVRALDYLASRPEVDPDRLAVTGRSGGGIYSWLITAVDDRVKTSVPTAGITDLGDYVIDEVVTGHCDCMFTVNSLRWNFSMIPALAAPRPILLANGDVDPIFPLDGVLRVSDKTRQVYGLYGALDRFDHVIVDAAHDDTPPLQQETFRWMHRHLKGEELQEPDSAWAIFDPAELKVFDELPEDEINTRIDELFVEPAPEPTLPGSPDEWARLRADWMAGLRQETFSGWPDGGETGNVHRARSASAPNADESGADRDASELPLGIERSASVQAEDVRIEAIDFDSQTSVHLRLWVLSHQDIVEPDSVVIAALDSSAWQEWLPILQAAAGSPSEADTLIGPGARATPRSEPDGQRLAALAERLRNTRTTLVVAAPRGVGATAWTETERGYGIRRSFMLLGQTVEGMQAWDLRRAVQVVRSDPALQAVPLMLEGRGVMGGIALYAALFEPGVSSLELYDLPETHRDGPILLNVRRVFDMPQAVAAALESVDTVRLRAAAPEQNRPDRGGADVAAEELWAWPRLLAERGHTSGKLQFDTGTPWLLAGGSPRP